MKHWMQKQLQRWVCYWYGAPDDPTCQVFFYRCRSCNSLVSWNMIKAGGCCPGGRIAPAYLSFWTELMILLCVWRWQPTREERRHA